MRHGHTIVRRATVVTVIFLLTVAIGVAAIHPAGGAASPTVFMGPDDPALKACQAAHTQMCNPEAESTRLAASLPAQPPSANPSYLSRQTIEAVAKRAAHTPLTPAAPITAVVYSALMPRPAYEALAHETHNAAVNAQRMVWVVTVHAPMATDGSPSRPPEIKHVYSVAYDAETGHWTDACIGCAWLNQSQ